MFRKHDAAQLAQKARQGDIDIQLACGELLALLDERAAGHGRPA